MNKQKNTQQKLLLNQNPNWDIDPELHLIDEILVKDLDLYEIENDDEIQFAQLLLKTALSYEHF